MLVLVCHYLTSNTRSTNLAAIHSTSYTKLVNQLIISETSLSKLANQVNPARPVNDQQCFKAGSSWILSQGAACGVCTLNVLELIHFNLYMIMNVVKKICNYVNESRVVFEEQQLLPQSYPQVVSV